MRHDVLPMTRLWASCVAEQDGRRESGAYNVSARDGWAFYAEDRVTRLVLAVTLVRQAAVVEIHPADVIPV